MLKKYHLMFWFTAPLLFSSASYAIDFACPLEICEKISATYHVNQREDGFFSGHYGVDFPVAEGSSVVASADGVVAVVGHTRVAGNYLILKHVSGYESLYVNLQSVVVDEGVIVMQGSEIAKSGNTGLYSTGPHLHFEIRKDGKNTDPLPLMIGGR